MKILLCLLFVSSVLVPCSQLSLQIFEDIKKKTSLDRDLAGASESIASQIAVIEKMNTVIRNARRICFVVPEAIPALQAITNGLKAAQDLIWMGVNGQSLAWSIKMLATPKINQPHRDILNPCGITGELKWAGETVIELSHPIGGSMVRNPNGNPYWHYYNPRVLPL